LAVAALMQSSVPGGRSSGRTQTSSVHLCGSQICGVPSRVPAVKKKSTRGALHVLDEVIHHGGEVGRDLYLHRSSLRGS
jgi:hypothetical protein